MRQREYGTNWVLLCWWYQSCLQENNLYHPACVVSPLSLYLSHFFTLSFSVVLPSSLSLSFYPIFISICLSFWHTCARTHNTLQGRDVFDIACHSQLVSFCCLVFIFYLQHQRALVLSPSLSLSLALFPSHTYTHTDTLCQSCLPPSFWREF